MDTSLFQPIANLIEKSQNILVLCHAKPDADALGASLSFYLAMKQLGKQVTVVTNEPAKETMAFLPAMNTLHTTLGGTKDFIISIDTKSKSISKIKYNADEGRVNIIITPKDGVFMASDVSFSAGKNQYDLIVAFDTGNVEYFGAIYDKNVQMFFETPIINIDHHASNTDYGQLNLVVPTAASTTEILYDYLVFLEKKHSKKLIDADIATLLLAGLITDTGSFQHANTSPRSLEVAAELLDLGGRQQEIIKHFFKTKKLSTLKLWGMILSKVQVDPLHRMVWSSISLEDFLSSEAEPEETEGIIDDLLTNAPGAEIIFLIKQNKDYVSISTRSTANGIDVGKMCAENGGGGHPRAAGFKVPGNRPFDEVVSEVVKKVREFQAKRLNIHADEPKLGTGDSGLGTREANQAQKPQAPEPKLGTGDSGLGTRETNQAQKQQSPVAQTTESAKEVKAPTEKKVTYLDFPAKQEVKPMVAPVAPAPAEQPKAAEPVTQPVKPAETPKPSDPKPETAPGTVGDSPMQGNEKIKAGQPEVKTPVTSVPKPVVPQTPAPIIEKKPDPKPVATQASAQPMAAKPANQNTTGATAPKKKHRKRHHKPKVGGNPATGKPVNPPTFQ